MKWYHWTALIVFAYILGAFWYYKHSTCPTCQASWVRWQMSFAQWKRRLGMRIIE